MIVSSLYLNLFLLSLLALYLLIRNISAQKSSYYVILFTLISVVCLAYSAYAMSTEVGTALLANKFTYFDGTFMMTFFLFCTLDICKIKVRPVFAGILMACNLIFMGLVFSVEKNHLLYSTYYFASDYGAGHLVIEFGPLHPIYLAYVIALTATPIAIIIYSLFHRTKISFKYTLALAGSEALLVILYFLSMSLNLKFDILPIGYVLIEYIILGIIHRIALYDGAEIVSFDIKDWKEFGYIIFDANGAYVGSDDVAKFYFPELNQLGVDRAVTDPFILEEFVNHLDDAYSEKPERRFYERENRIIGCIIKPYHPRGKDKAYGYLVEIHDDTEQQMMIQALNNMNAVLEEAVEEANSASRAKSDFLASMSHEIRTPINAILGMNEIAIRECDDERILNYLSDIRNAGTNLLFIINDILDFSKIEAGRIEIIEGDYSAIKTVRDVKMMVESKAKAKGLELNVVFSEDIPVTLCGDENRVRQIMINLLNNAVKYTHEGNVEFRIGGIEREDGLFELHFAVQDTGIGIRKEDIGSLFESFKRVDEQKNKSIEGTGLGLAITKRLSEMMGGSVSVESVYGEGSTFSVVLPQKIVDKTPSGSFDEYESKRTVKKEAGEHIDASNLEILIVDDTLMNIKVAKGLLKPTKAKVDSATSGRECLEMLKQKKYDFVFLDHMMPEMDGVETLHAARKLEGSLCSDTIFIALTANAISGVREMFLHEGFDDYLSKPVNPAQLEAMLSHYMSR